MTEKTNPPGRVMLKNVRLSFPALFTPEAYNPGDEEKFKATFLIPKTSPQIKEIEDAIMVALTAHPKVGPKRAAAVFAQIRGNSNKCSWQDGDLAQYDGYAGMMSLSAKAKASARPTVIDGNKQPLTEKDGKPYAGCYVNASVDVYAYDSSGIGVTASLRGVQFLRDGDAFAAGRPADSDEFEAVTDGADAGEFA